MSWDPRAANYRKELPRESEFCPATAAQENYIQLLANDLQYTENQRDIQISSIIKKPFSWFGYKLSKESASKVIGQFKAWKEAKDS